MSVDKQQFQLPFTAKNGHPRKSAATAHEELKRSLPERVAGIDQVLSTLDIERIIGLERWLSGAQNQRQSSGGLGTQS